MILAFVFFAITAGFAFAVADVADKMLLAGHVRRPSTRVFFSGILAPFIALPALLLSTDLFPGFRTAGVAILAGGVLTVGTVVLLRAIQGGEVSRVVLLLQTNPVFLLVLSIIFLGEVLIARQYVGLTILVVAALLAAFKHPAKGMPKLRIDATVKNTLMARLLLSSAYLIVVSLVMRTDLYAVFYWWQVGLFMFAPLLLIDGATRSEVHRILSKRPRTAIVLIVIGAVSYVVAYLALTVAFAQAPAAIVAAIAAVSPLFVMLLIALLQRRGFDMFEERFTRTEIITKVFTALLFIIGIYIVS